MKTLIPLVVLLLLSFQTKIFSQPCLPEGITFSTQTQIDNFQSDYPGCTEIEGSVTISGSGITHLNGLNVLTSIGGDLSIFENDSLTSLTGLGNLTSVGGNVRIAGNPVLTSVSALNNLTYIPGNLEIGVFYAQNFHGNPLLSDLTGFNNLDSIGGSLHIFQNSSLLDLRGLGNLKKIMIDLEIGGMWAGGNWSMIDLTGMGNLVSVGGTFEVVQNRALKDFSGLDNLICIGGNLTIYDNDSLINLSGLSNLNAIGGSLYMGWFMYYPGNPSLIDLSGLENVTSIGGTVQIDGNSSLTSLSGLNNVTSINGDLNIRSNGALKSLSGLDNITAGSVDNLNIWDNDSLSNCEVQSICDYLANPNGNISIVGNAPGCNSQEEVEAACGITSVEENSVGDVLVIAPNPAERIVDCQLLVPAKTGIDCQSIILKVFDLYGKEVWTLMDEVKSPGEYTTRMDVSTLPVGIYLVRLQAGEQVGTVKVVVMR